MFSSRKSILLCVLFFGITACSSASLPLVRKGRGVSAIVLTNYATAREKQAAAVLQHYVAAITNQRLPIVTKADPTYETHIWIGQAAFDQKESLASLVPDGEGFALLSDAPNVYVLGRKGKSVLYAVYSLLEQYFGVRKYDAGPANFTARKDLNLPDQLQEVSQSPFVYRESFYPMSMDAEYLDWHKLHRFEDLWGVWGHSFFKFVPPETYFGTHPEYYALVNGKRQATQLCLSHPEVLQLTETWLKKHMTAFPDAVYWSIAPMDGAGYCTCSRCSEIDAVEGGPQGSLIRFVNAIAAKFPDQQFTTLAYGYSANAPLKTKPASNVFIMLSTIDAYRQLPLSSEPKAAAFRKQLQDWASRTSNLFIWDYTTQFTAYLNPFPMYDTYQTNIRYLMEQGVKGIFEQGGGNTWSDMAPLASYLQAKLLWNPHIDLSAVRQDFLQGYYGKAAPFITQYLNALIAARNASRALLDIYGNPILDRTTYLSPQRIEGYSELLDQAEAAVEGNEILSAHVGAVRLSLEYAVLQQSRSYGVNPYGYLEKMGKTYQVKSNWPTRVQRFVAQAKQMGAIELSENGASPDAYALEWKQLFERPYMPSILLGRQVELKNAYLPDYPANGVQTLTDGLTGNIDFSYNWLLFEGRDVDALIYLPTDLNKMMPLTFNYLVDPRHYIFAPTRLIVEGSADGKNFQVMKELALQEKETEEAFIQRTEVMLPLFKDVKYLRFVLKCPVDLPDWFSGARNRKPLIALDEVSM